MRWSSDARSLRRLREMPLLRAIEPERWPSLAPHVGFVDLAEGELLFRAGRAGERLYLVVSGELGLDLPRTAATDRPDDTPERSPIRLQRRGPGETAGDFAVLNGGAHLVSAVATCRTRVAGLPRFAFERLAGIDPEILAHVYDRAAALSRRVTLARAFVALFGEIDTGTLDALLDASELRHYRSGDTLFHEGDEADGLYLVVSGRLHVETRAGADRRRIAEVQAPESVGELALLANSTRSATVHAARESTVARLDRDVFERLIAPRPDLLMALSRLVIKRHVEDVADNPPRARDRNFVILPLDARLPLRRFLHQVRRALRDTVGETLSLDARGFDTLYGKSGAAATTFDDPFSGAVAEWLDDKENRTEALVYVADASLTPWTLRAVNRADRILLLANAKEGADPARRRLERELESLFTGRSYRPRIELVLLHPADTARPRETRRWLAPRQVDAFHHVRLDDVEHIGRLVRRLTGRALAIVFSGGGARGYAHLGVQRLIEEEGIRIDCIGGSSMGGLLGASMALGQTATQVSRLSSRFASRRALFDYTLPLTSLMRSEKLSQFCREVYGDARIEDLWTPFFCVSSNLADGREIVHDTGRLWRVIRSTISLPGVFSPVPTPNGDLLIDGAVLNTFPVDVMHERLGGAGRIIGVNVSEVPERFDYYDFGTSLSGWRVFLSRLNPFGPRIRNPRIAETLLRSTDIKGIGRLNATRAMIDVLVEPDVRDIALLDFKSYTRISDIGYAAAREVFAAHGLRAAPADDGTVPDAESSSTSTSGVCPDTGPDTDPMAPSNPSPSPITGPITSASVDAATPDDAPGGVRPADALRSRRNTDD